MKRRPAVRWLRTVGALLVAAAAIEYGVVPQVVAGLSNVSLLEDVSPVLLFLALSVEAASLVAYTGLTQRLLGADRLSGWTQLRIDLTGYGASHVLPGGGATAAALRYGLMVERGVAEPAAASLQAVQAVLAGLGLVAAWALGSALALPRTGSVSTGVLLACVAVGAAAGGQWLATGGRIPPALRTLATRVLSVAPQRLRSFAAAFVRSVTGTVRNTDAVRSGLAWSTCNWLLDALCLWLCLRGFGDDLAPELVLVAYGVAMLVGLLPVTPGGLGIVEGLLVPGLVAAGAAAGPAVLAALTWRLLQFWLPIPVAAVCWLSLSGPSAGRRARPSGPSHPDPRPRSGPTWVASTEL